jgi:acetyl-CoA carboxylase carboxyltransferase component
MSYDYTVLAGTQGMRNHLKKDRLFEIAERRRLPVVLFAEGGGGAQAMAGGGFKAPLFTVGWPTSEFGAMGLEGAVRLGMRRELAAIEDPAERERAFEAAVAAAYDRGKGISIAEYFEIDDVIDPADTRRWIKMLVDRAQANGGGGPPRGASTSMRGEGPTPTAPLHSPGP